MLTKDTLDSWYKDRFALSPLTKEDEEELTKQKRQEEADDCDRDEALQF